MTLGKFLAALLFLASIWLLVNSKGAVHEIEAILIFMCSVIMAGIEKLAAVIQAKPTPITIVKEEK